MGIRTLLNLASVTFFSITFLEPFLVRTRSSLGRLKAAVCTPARVSPAVKSSITTLIGEAAPRLVKYFLGSGRLRSTWVLYLASFCSRAL